MLFRTILVLNLFVVGLALVMGYVAREAAGKVVERRLTSDLAIGVSTFLKNKGLPPSDTIMAYLSELFGAHWVAIHRDTGEFLGSSLPEPLSSEFRGLLPNLKAGRLTLHAGPFHVAYHDVGSSDPSTNGHDTFRLYTLVPSEQFEEARSRAGADMLSVFLYSTSIATVVAVVFSITITRPIRRLAREMDSIASRAGSENPWPDSQPGQMAPVPSSRLESFVHGPHEIVSLASSFQNLLKRLSEARQDQARNERLATLGKVCLSVAHELRNPLSGIKMNVRVLKDERPGGPGSASLELILREIERMDLYLQELLTLSTEPSSGFPNNRPLATVPAKLSDLAESVLGILSGRCRHSRIHVERSYPADEPLVHVSPDPIRQGIMNILINAIEAMPDGGSLRVAVRRQDDAVRLTVVDTGRGVQNDSGRRDIFEAFVTNKPNGVGLGLYLTKQTIRRHRGRIGFDSSEQGATFWVELPYAGLDLADGRQLLPESN